MKAWTKGFYGAHKLQSCFRKLPSWLTYCMTDISRMPQARNVISSKIRSNSLYKLGPKCHKPFGGPQR